MPTLTWCEGAGRRICLSPNLILLTNSSAEINNLHRMPVDDARLKNYRIPMNLLQVSCLECLRFAKTIVTKEASLPLALNCELTLTRKVSV